MEHLLHMLLNAGPGPAFDYFLHSLNEKYGHVLRHIQRKAAEDDIVEKQNEEIKQLKDKLGKADQRLKDYKHTFDVLRDHYEETTMKLQNYENKFNTMELLCETTLRTFQEYKLNYNSIKQQFGVTNAKLESYEQKFTSMEVLLDAVSSKFWELEDENKSLKETDQFKSAFLCKFRPLHE
ncbi:hypothetical protein Btru_047830 [Bulinus truncatus]|nr:hypothetical protein Btru_047830 [Bulinus truncatus]